MLGRFAAVAITFCRQGASFACCEVGWGGCRCGVGLVVAQSYVLEFFEVLSSMRRGSLLRSFYSVQTVCLAVACEYLGKLCGLGVVKRRRSRVCAVCGMFVGAAIFAGSICALSRNARVGAEFRSGKCEFAHVMVYYESK